MEKFTFEDLACQCHLGDGNKEIKKERTERKGTQKTITEKGKNEKSLEASKSYRIQASRPLVVPYGSRVIV